MAYYRLFVQVNISVFRQIRAKTPITNKNKTNFQFSKSYTVRKISQRVPEKLEIFKSVSRIGNLRKTYIVAEVLIELISLIFFGLLIMTFDNHMTNLYRYRSNKSRHDNYFITFYNS